VVLIEGCVLKGILRVYDLLADIGNWLGSAAPANSLIEIKRFLTSSNGFTNAFAVTGVTVSAVILLETIRAQWRKLRGRFDSYDAVVDNYINFGPASANKDLVALETPALDSKHIGQLRRDMLAIKRMLGDMKSLKGPQREALRKRLDEDPEYYREFLADLEAIERSMTEAEGEDIATWDLRKHRRTLTKYWRQHQNPYDRAIRSLAEQSVSSENAKLAGQTYAEE
jgi:hypothetical protein